MRIAKLSVKKEKVTIDRTTESVEVDFDFTQIYDCFFLLSMSITTGSSFQILFFLLRNMTKENTISVNKKLIQRFFGMARQVGKEPITEQSFYRSLQELQKAGVMTKLSRGQYFMNPYAMWKDDKVKRTEYIIAQSGEKGQKFSYNPLELLSAKMIPDKYEIEESITDAEIERVTKEEIDKLYSDGQD